MQINFYCEEKGEGRVERLVADVFIIDNFLDYQKELVLYKFFLLYPTYISFSSTIPQISISWQACFAQLQRKPFKDTKNWRRRYCLGKEWTKRNPSEFLFFFLLAPLLADSKNHIIWVFCSHLPLYFFSQNFSSQGFFSFHFFIFIFIFFSAVFSWFSVGLELPGGTIFQSIPVVHCRQAAGIPGENGLCTSSLVRVSFISEPLISSCITFV